MIKRIFEWAERKGRERAYNEDRPDMLVSIAKLEALAKQFPCPMPKLEAKIIELKKEWNAP